MVGVVVLFDEGDRADNIVGYGLTAGELQGGAHGGALPDGGGADRLGGAWLRPGGEALVDDGLAHAKLGDDGHHGALGGGGDATVGCVIAEPDDVGDQGVEVGKVERGDVAADAVDHEPGAGLPGPMDGFGGQGVVDAQGSANHEGAVGDVVNFAEGPLLPDAIDVEVADAEGGAGPGVGPGCGLRRGVGNVVGGAEGNGVDFGAFRCGGKGAGEDE